MVFGAAVTEILFESFLAANFANCRELVKNFAKIRVIRGWWFLEQ